MPHSTVPAGDRHTPLGRAKSYNDAASSQAGLEQFPQMDTIDNSAFDPTVSRWAPRREHTYANGPTPTSRTNGHTRQKSLSEAFRTIRTRGGSVSQNVHEITDALKAPVSPVLVVLCILWYTSSVLTNTSSKSILMTLDKPATLTIVQFAFVSFFCLVCSAVASAFPHLRATIPALKNPIRSPTRDILKTTLPLALFQIGGHLLSSNATLLIPVSLVHTIKGLSPLFTVLAYRFIYDIRYPVATYISLVPLTLGVMLACSGKHAFGGELLGVLYALAAALIFVTQNIVSKRLFNEAAKAEMQGLGAKSRKLDKLNLLCYSAGLAFILTAPIWFWSEGIEMLRDFLHDGSIDLNERPQSLDHGRLVLEFIFNGTFHFGQNIIAFQLLSMVSPVTYSVASLLKRVFVITVTLVWFRSPTTWVQGAGIALTFLGLYMYDRASASNKADNKVRSMADSPKNAPILPLADRKTVSPLNGGPLPSYYGNGNAAAASHGYTNGGTGAEYSKKSDDPHGPRPRGLSNAPLPPRTRQEDTWLAADRAIGVQ